MLNYVHGELWRAFRKAGSVAFFGLMILLPLVGNVLFCFLNFSWHTYQMEARISLMDGLVFFKTQIPFWGCLLTFIMSGIVFGDELRLQTIKNSIAFGTGRGVVYFGKFLAELVYSLLGLFVAAGMLLVSGLILLPWDLSQLPRILDGYFRLFLGCIPLWVGILGFLHLLLFTVQNGVAIAGISMVTAFLALLFVSVPASNARNLYLPAWLMELAFYATDVEFLSITFLTKCWGIGIIYTGVFSLIGYLTFCRRELK